MADFLLFSALSASHGWELWRSDGTDSGTTRVIDPADGGSPDGAYGAVAVGDTAYFFAYSGDRFVLWSTDGTSAGTSVVDLLAATDGWGGSTLTAVGDRLYFTAEDGVHGAELWVARPGQAPAAMVVDLLPGADGAGPVPVGVLGDKLVFAAIGADGARALWSSDGSAEGTERLTVAGVDAAAVRGAAADGILYFLAEDAGYGRELWRTDGTAAGTARATDLVATPVGSRELAALDGAVFFAATTAGEGEELWRFDGETASILTDISAGAGDSAPGGFAVMGGVLYFTATDGIHGRELWRTDGTSTGTYQVADINNGGSSNPAHLRVVGDRLFFSANDGLHGPELWASDGTAAGTVLVADLNGGAGASPRELVVLQGVPPVVDTTAPDTFIASGPPPIDTATTAEFDLGSNEADVSFEMALDGGPWQAASDPLTLSGLSAGSHLLLVRAIDQAGNVDPTPAEYRWAVGGPSADTIAPDTAILSGPPVNGAGATASFVFDSDEPEVAYEASVDGGPFLTVVNPLFMQGLAPGPHTLLARAVDPSGNVDATPAAYSWFVGDDADAPDTLVTSGPAATSAAQVAVFDLAATEPGARFEARLDDGGWQPVHDPLVLFALAAGGHVLQVRAIDAAGNIDESPASWSWTVDPDIRAADAGPVPVAGGKVLVALSHADADAVMADDGIQWIQAHASLRLPDSVANLSLLGGDEFNADGNALPNLLVGNEAANILVGYAGNDSIVGEGGADVLAAGAGDDTVWGDDLAGGQDGDDTVWGGQGNDSILGGGGRDLLNGDRGADTLLGGGGDDLLNGGANGDWIDGGEGADLIRGGQGQDLLLGGAGDDTLAGDLGADTLWGGAGDDLFVLLADGSIDVIGGFTAGSDRLQIAADTGIIDEATFRARAHDDGSHTVLDLGAGSWVVLLGVRPAQISIEDLLIV